MFKKVVCYTLLALSLVVLLAGAQTATNEYKDYKEDENIESIRELSDGAVEITMTLPPMAGAPVSQALKPEASGTVVKSNKNALIDASHTDMGYVMIKYTGKNTAAKKVIVTGPSKVDYIYDLNSKGQFEVFPLSDGSGTYKIAVYQNIRDSRYSTLYRVNLDVKLKDEFAPFLLSNQYVNYTLDGKAATLAKQLTAGKKTTLDKITAVYEYVVRNISYDYEKVKTLKSGYLPDLDTVLKEKKGICFDYAALMTAMLRSQNIPTKLVIGYSGQAYHAWISTWTPESGWIEQTIFFDGKSWKLMDPTFASTGKESASIMQYINTPGNYQAKYLY